MSLLSRFWNSEKQVPGGRMIRHGLTRTFEIENGELACAVLKKEEQYQPSNLIRTMMSALTGRNMLSTVGKEWENARTTANSSFFGKKSEKILRDVIDAQSAKITENIPAKADEKGVDMNTLVRHYTVGVMASAIFGKDVSDDDAKSLMDTLEESFQGKRVSLWHKANLILMAVGLPSLFPMQTAKKISAMKEGPSRQTLEIIDRKFAAMRSPGAAPDETLLGMIATMKDRKGAPLNAEQAFDHVMSFTAAGYFSTSITILQGVSEIMKNDEIYKRVIDEARRYDPRKALPDDLAASFPYINQCVNETMRLYPPVSTLSRRARASHEFNGVAIGRGDVLAIKLNKIQRDPAAFENPDAFMPERFERKVAARHHLPFGHGPRSCLGRNPAREEAISFIFRLFSQYDAKAVQNYTGTRTTPLFTAPEGSLMLDITPRADLQAV